MFAFSFTTDVAVLIITALIAIALIAVVVAFRPQIRWTRDGQAYVFPKGRWSPGFALTGVEEARRLSLRIQVYFVLPVAALLPGELIDRLHDLPPIATTALVLLGVVAGRGWTAHVVDRVFRSTPTVAAAAQ
ncbi:MAG: hypothetical protein ACKVP7_11880 [Hyphomicrobiaceae bacterium]